MTVFGLVKRLYPCSLFSGTLRFRLTVVALIQLQTTMRLHVFRPMLRERGDGGPVLYLATLFFNDSLRRLVENI